MNRNELELTAENSSLDCSKVKVMKMIKLLSIENTMYYLKDENKRPNRFISDGFKFDEGSSSVEMFIQNPITEERISWGSLYNFDEVLDSINWNNFEMMLFEEFGIEYQSSLDLDMCR